MRIEIWRISYDKFTYLENQGVIRRVPFSYVTSLIWPPKRETKPAPPASKEGPGSD